MPRHSIYPCGRRMVILQHKDYGLLTTTFTICQNWLVRVSPVSRKVACSRPQNGGENGSRKMCKKPPENWGESARSFLPLARFFTRPHWPRAWNRLVAKRIPVLIRTSQTDKSIHKYMVCTAAMDSTENFQKRLISHFKMTGSTDQFWLLLSALGPLDQKPRHDSYLPRLSSDVKVWELSWTVCGAHIATKQR